MRAERHIRKRLRHAVAPQAAEVETSLSKYSHGEYVRIEVASGADEAISIWMRVDHCDDQHSIVFGIIDDDKSQELGDAFRSGAHLAASYRQVRK